MSYLLGGIVILERQKELNLMGLVEKMMVDLRVVHGMEMMQEMLPAELKQQEQRVVSQEEVKELLVLVRLDIEEAEETMVRDAWKKVC